MHFSVLHFKSSQFGFDMYYIVSLYLVLELNVFILVLIGQEELISLQKQLEDREQALGRLQDQAIPESPNTEQSQSTEKGTVRTCCYINNMPTFMCN